MSLFPYTTLFRSWEFAGWSGDASGLDKEYVVASLAKDMNLGAAFKFVGKDSLKYEAENTVYKQALFEDKHEGFSGKGYANLDNAVGSSITFALCLPEGYERNVKLTFANGGSANRPVSISVNGKVLVERLDLEPTGGWTTWNDAELTLKIPAGVNTLEIASLTEDGAPNIDKIEFVRADSGTTVLRKIAPAEVSRARTGKQFYVNGRAVNARRAGNRKAVQPTFAK